MTLWRAFKLASVVALLFVLAAGVYVWTSGVRFYAVDSGSMSPTFNTGALVVDQPVGPTTVYQVGDVVTFHPTPGYTATHRIVAIGKDGITTKGDANPSSDVGTIQTSMIAGRVAFTVPYGGYIAVFFQHPAGPIGLVILLVGLSVAWELTKDRPGTPQAVTSSGEDSP
jgi:signal peptidase I